MTDFRFFTICAAAVVWTALIQAPRIAASWKKPDVIRAEGQANVLRLDAETKQILELLKTIE